jgi:hypothetical protein
MSPQAALNVRATSPPQSLPGPGIDRIGYRDVIEALGDEYASSPDRWQES